LHRLKLGEAGEIGEADADPDRVASPTIDQRAQEKQDMADTDDDLEDPGEWFVTPLKDELTGDLSCEFKFPVGDGTTGTLELGNVLSPKQMVKQLSRRTRMLPRGAVQFLEELIDAAPSSYVVKARQPGWKTAPGSFDGRFVAFVAVAPGGQLHVTNPRKFVGVRCRQNGKVVIGLRKEGVTSLVGASMVRPVFERLGELGAINKGHGGKSTQQLRVTPQNRREDGEEAPLSHDPAREHSLSHGGRATRS
jgi:hypothetical protein